MISTVKLANLPTGEILETFIKSLQTVVPELKNQKEPWWQSVYVFFNLQSDKAIFVTTEIELEVLNKVFDGDSDWVRLN